jgi:ATP-dependent DNA helicase RecQ
MSTTKRSRTTKKKEPTRTSAASRASATKAKRAPKREPVGKATAEPAVKKARSKKPAARGVAVEPPPPPPSPPARAPAPQAYTLDGAVPPEAEGLPRKVGALLGIGQRTLGIKTFRPGQAQAFEHLLAGEDLLAVMPTGSGKSLLYQLTSLVVPGVTVVVSPLIALIKDQLDKMVAKGVSACKIDSTLTVKQRREVDALVRSPGGKLLLTTPERMADPEFRVFLREACGGVGVSRFVVDEAHCVSTWGHDFRPAYLSLRKALEDVGRPPVLATTATAPPHVRDDILFQLGMEGAPTVTTTFDRPNLHYEVIVFGDEGEKMKTLVTLLKKLPRPGIVYCATVKKVEELYEALTRWGIPVSRYHGRLSKRERDDSQQRFMDSSDLVMVATNAFGLGVDKSNIRNVLHYHVPGSLEAYAQEAGRGGRDGRPARCVLLFSPDDVAIQEYFLSGTYPTKRQVRQVFEALEAFTELHRGSGRLAEESPPSVANVALSSGVGQQRTRTVLSLLKDEQFVIEHEGGLFFVADPPPEPYVLADRARQYEARRIADRQRLDALLAYVKAPGCRNQVILDYLGEPDPPKCGRCDNCLRSREAALAASTEATRLGASLTRQLDDDGTEVKPRREIRARVVRIDQPPAAAPAPTPPPVAAPPKSAPTVLRRSAASAAASPASGAGHAKAEPPGRPGAAPASNGHATDPGSRRTAAQVAQAGPPARAAEPAVSRSARPAEPAPPTPGNGDEAIEDDELEDDELEDDELEGEDGEEGEDEDGEEGEDDDDDDLAEGEDDDLDDDDEDDDDDDDGEDDDDDDYEVIDKTAAEIAEEGVEGPGEITVLARKRVPKQAKQRPELATDSPSASAAEARRRRRRRRRKRRAMLPPKSAFTTPVLSTSAPMPESMSRRMSGGGPVIEYVRGPMRIAMAPVASANPNDAGAARPRRAKKLRRWERGGFREGGSRPGPDRGGDRFDGRGGAMVRTDGPRPAPWAKGDGNGAAPGQGPGPGPGPGNERRRRRRRRRRRPGEGPATPGQGEFAPASNGGPPDAPVSFFAPAGGGAPGPVALGPDGQPLRKRRRRRRRGRGGRQREWRTQGQGGPGGGDGGGGAPPSGGGVGSISDGGDGSG